MNEGDRTHQYTTEANSTGALCDSKSVNVELPTTSGSSPPVGGNGGNLNIVSTVTSTQSSPTNPSNTTTYSGPKTVITTGVSHETQNGESSVTYSDTSTDTFHTPSTSLQNLSGPHTILSRHNAFRRQTEFQSDASYHHQQLLLEQHFCEEEEEVVLQRAPSSTTLPVTLTESLAREDGGDGDGIDDEELEQHLNETFSQKTFPHHKRQNSAESQCSLSSNPENSQFKTADAHSSDSDASRNSGTVPGFVFDKAGSTCGIGIIGKEEPDRTSLQSDLSLSGEYLNTSVESVDIGIGGGVLLESVERNILTSRINSGVTSSITVIKSGGISPQSHISPSVKPRVKKKMWYQQIFSTSYKTRSGDFKKIFKELPPKERLIVDYSCALQKEILLQGRMYVSQNFVSFYANIFGWETQTSISFKEIESITKEKTALIIPNAIQLSTMTEKFFFSSFVTRDTTYVMLFKLWQSALLEDNMTKKELWRLVHTCYGEELGVTSEDESEDKYCPPLVTSAVGALLTSSEIDEVKTINIDPERTNSTSTATFEDVTVEKSDDGEDDDDPRIGSWNWCRLRRASAISGMICTGEVGSAIAVGLNLGSSIVTSNGIPISEQSLLKDVGIVPLPVLPMTVDPSDSSDTEAPESELRSDISVIVPVPISAEAIDLGSETIPCVPPVCPVDHSAGKEMVNTVIPCNIDQLFTMLFTNSKFILDFQLSRKTCDINQSDWQLGDGSHKTRQLTFTVLTGQALGPKQAQVTETQTLLPASRPGLLYAIQSESVNAGIPYADAFSINCHYCLTKLSQTEAKLLVITKVNYKKNVWAKSFIEKNSMAGMADHFINLERALKEECAKMNAGGITPTSPIISNMPRRRHPRKKCRAPDIPAAALTRPILESSIIHPTLGLRSSLPTMTQETYGETLMESGESSLVIKLILTVLGCLLLLNGFLYFKLTNLETAASTSVLYPPIVQFPGETPQTHQEWLGVLQQQETLHRSEVQNWHEILASAIKILHQAENDLESLKSHISLYGRENILKAVHQESTANLESTISTQSISTGETTPAIQVNYDATIGDSKSNENVITIANLGESGG